MTKYQLTCGCGKSVSVDAGQAGEQVTCQCGASLEVPPLRKLRHLPVAAQDVNRRASSWSARRGIIAACLILATALAAVTLWNRVTEPKLAPFSPVVRQQVVEEGLSKLTPAEAWHLWVSRYRPLAEQGIVEFEHPHAAAIDQEVSKRRFFQRTLLAVAATFAAVAALAALWPRSASRRG
jgi:hypothetical protein